jgi:hypothetical protein
MAMQPNSNTGRRAPDLAWDVRRAKEPLDLCRDFRLGIEC